MQPWDRPPQSVGLQSVPVLDLAYLLHFPEVENPWTREGGRVPVVTFVRQASGRPRPPLRTVGSHPVGDDFVPNNWLEVGQLHRNVVRQIRGVAQRVASNAAVLRHQEGWPIGVPAVELGDRLVALARLSESPTARRILNTGNVLKIFPDDVCWQRGFRGPTEALYELILVRLWNACAVEDIAMGPAPELSAHNPFVGSMAGAASPHSLSL